MIGDMYTFLLRVLIMYTDVLQRGSPSSKHTVSVMPVIGSVSSIQFLRFLHMSMRPRLTVSVRRGSIHGRSRCGCLAFMQPFGW